MSEMTSNGIYKFLLSFHIIPSTTFPRQLKIILASLSVWNPPWPPLLKSVFFKTGKHPHSPIQIEVTKTKFFYLFLKVSRKTLPPISFSKILSTLLEKISPPKSQHNIYKEYSICNFFGGHFFILYVIVTVAHVSDVFRTLSNTLDGAPWKIVDGF